MATKYLAVDELLKQKAQLWDEHGVGIYAVGTGNILAMPAADVVPVAFKGFAEWVADWVLRSDFEENAGGFAELACRRLEALGIMRKEGHYWVRNEVESHEID